MFRYCGNPSTSVMMSPPRHQLRIPCSLSSAPPRHDRHHSVQVLESDRAARSSSGAALPAGARRTHRGRLYAYATTLLGKQPRLRSRAYGLAHGHFEGCLAAVHILEEVNKALLVSAFFRVSRTFGTPSWHPA